jgi:hypothetical protein
MAAALVRDHPGFALAQLLHGDLLAARAGWPAAFGVDGSSTRDTQDPRRLGLRLEAQRRLAALREPAPAGMVPAEFVRLAPSIRHAVAVDASRSRLYLFAHGPQGLSLLRDFYVSLGKQGVDKQVEGDRRTPLGVYWITAALPKQTLDERFGDGALRFNYPNAADRIQGRTGRGLFLHGVPAHTLNHEPWATDGCVAMSNTDIEQLLQALDVAATPVVITRAIHWVSRDKARQTAAEFAPVWQAWSLARRDASVNPAARWYLPGATPSRRWKPDPQEGGQLSLVSWKGDGAPMMIVTAHAQNLQASEPVTYRQYWTRDQQQWRIAFEGPVAAPVDGTASAARLSVNPETGVPDEVANDQNARQPAPREAKARQEARRTERRPEARADRRVRTRSAASAGPTAPDPATDTATDGV